MSDQTQEQGDKPAGLQDGQAQSQEGSEKSGMEKVKEYVKKDGERQANDEIWGNNNPT